MKISKPAKMNDSGIGLTDDDHKHSEQPVSGHTTADKPVSRFWKILLTMGGAGYVPYAPGTAGALVALAAGIFIIKVTVFPNIIFIILIIGFTILGITGSNRLEAEWGKDPKRIVIDEAVGMWISMLFITNGWLAFLAAFVFFRFFDIVKPLGIRSTEKLPGGVGVMADDILAGFYAFLSVQLLLLILMITLW